MDTTNLFYDRQMNEWSSSERRLLGLSAMKKGADNLEAQAKEILADLADPKKARERIMVHQGEQLRVFAQPRIFQEPKNVNANTGDVVMDRLLHLEPHERLEEFQKYIDHELPIETRQDYADVLTITTEADVHTALRVLQILAGEKVSRTDDPLASEIAEHAIEYRNNTALGSGGVTESYMEWRRRHPAISGMDVTSPTEILRDPTLPKNLKAALESYLDPREQEDFLRNLDEIYRNDSTNRHLAHAGQHLEYAKLVGRGEAEKLKKESTSVIENFKNAGLPAQLLAVGLGIFVINKMRKSGLGSAALIGLGGFYLWDKIGNGNANAEDDLLKKGKQFATFTGKKLNELLVTIGVKGIGKIPSSFTTVSEFIERNKMKMESTTAMAVLASLDIDVVAKAFNPDSGLGGHFTFDSGKNFDTTKDGRLIERSVDPLGAMFQTQIDTRMDGLGITNRGDKQRILDYLKSQNNESGIAFGRVLYLIGSEHMGNIKDAEEIDSLVESTYQTYEKLPTDKQARYNEIMLAGWRDVMDDSSSYKGRDLGGVMAELKAKKEARVSSQKSQDTATALEPTTNRTAEFSSLSTIAGAPVETTTKADVLDGPVERDAREFIENCSVGDPPILSAEGVTTLAETFDRIRTKTNRVGDDTVSLSEKLTLIEKIKYGVFIRAMEKKGQSLGRSDIEAVAGKSDLDIKSMVDKVGSFISSYIVSVPRGFQSMSSLSDVRSLLSQPILGSGPLAGDKSGLTDLGKKIDDIEARFKEKRNTSAIAEKILKELPTASLVGTAPFETKEKLLAFIQKTLDSGTYGQRLDRKEKYLAQKLGTSLARNMLLRASSRGFGDRSNEMSVSNIEIQNVMKEADALTSATDDMWENVETIDTLARFPLTSIDSADFSKQSTCLDMIAYAKELSTLSLTLIARGKNSPALTSEISERIDKIYTKLADEKSKQTLNAIQKVQSAPPSTPATNVPDSEKEKMLKNLYNCLVIENQTKFSDTTFMELKGLLRLTGKDKPTNDVIDFRKLGRDQDFPPDYKRPDFDTKAFIEKLKGFKDSFRPLEWWKEQWEYWTK